jgi:hypothetical protein
MPADSKAVLQVAPQAVLTYIYPLKGNEAALKLDLLSGEGDVVAVCMCVLIAWVSSALVSHLLLYLIYSAAATTVPPLSPSPTRPPPKKKPIAPPVNANRNAALETIRRRQMTMQGPFKLAQGYQGLVFRLPVLLPANSPNETWG